jgi:dienelactone hydrolase
VAVLRSELRFAGRGGDALRAVVLRGPAAQGADAGAQGAAAVLVHDALGLDEAMLAAGARLARGGRVVLAVDLYAREGTPRVAAPGPAAARELERAVPDRRVLADLEAALERLGREPDVDPERVALVGLGAGGTWAFLAACASSRAAAVVDVQGRLVHDRLDRETPLQPLELALNLGAPALIVLGADDPATPPDEVERARAVLTQFARDFELHALPGFGAGLAGRGGVAEATSERVWALVEDFLARRL